MNQQQLESFVSNGRNAQNACDQEIIKCLVKQNGVMRESLSSVIQLLEDILPVIGMTTRTRCDEELQLLLSIKEDLSNM